MRLRLRVRRMRLRVRRGRPVSLPFLRRTTRSAAAPNPGLHAYTREPAPGERTRLHLRVEADGRGTLVVNANRIVHLNPTATSMAWLILEGIPEAQALARLAGAYRVPRRQLQSDWREVHAQVEALARPDGACPIHDLGLDVLQPFSQVPSAPYRIDLALTYRCNDNCAHCYNARPRDYPELDTAGWMQIIDRIRDVGVPHLCFTGGEATLRDDLPTLVGYARGEGTGHWSAIQWPPAVRSSLRAGAHPRRARPRADHARVRMTRAFTIAWSRHVAPGDKPSPA